MMRPARITIIFLFLRNFCMGQASQTEVISLLQELQPFYKIAELPQFRDHSVNAQVSSYDTTGDNDDGFSGKYSYIRKFPDSTLLLVDIKGAGVVNRIWTPTPTEDTLDFYIDDTARATLSIKFSDLFSGKVFPFVAPLCGNQVGGNFCYFPILFQKSFRLVSRGKKMQFHQVQYRLFPGPTQVRPFNPRLSTEEKSALDTIALFWNKEKRSIADFASAAPGRMEAITNIDIKPGQTKTVWRSDKGGRVLGIEFEAPGGNAWINKNLDISITWDDETVPAVYCPVADFFGYAFGKASMQSLLLGSLNNINYCYFPMPFQRKANIRLIYRAAGSDSARVIVRARIFYSTQKIDPAKEGKFYTHWNSKRLAMGDGPHIFLDTKGRGHYVGTILQAQGVKAGMTYFFEGDDSTAIDGQFRIHGTGSEDYFNGGWYALPDQWDAKTSLPLHGCLEYALPFSQTGGYRLYLSDKLSFQQSIFHSIEHGPVGNQEPVEYTSLAIYYSDASPASASKSTNTIDQRSVPDSLILYPQLMNVSTWGEIGIEPLWTDYGTGGQSYIYTANSETRVRISLEELPYGKYKLFADFVQIPEGCEFALWQRQHPVSGWINTRNSAKERKALFYVNDVTIADFKTTLTIRFKTDQNNKRLFLNRLIFVRSERK